MTRPSLSTAAAVVLRDSDVPVVAIDLDSWTVVDANDSYAALVEVDLPSLRGARIRDVLEPADRQYLESALALVGTGAMLGYQAARHFHDREATYWVRRIGIEDRIVLLSVTPADGATFPWPLTNTDIKIALAVTDHDWAIEHVSSDIEDLLGDPPERYIGSPVLALIQPADAQDFLLATGQIADDRGGATLRLHLRTAKGQWKIAACLVVAMCRHSPPRLGLALGAITEDNMADCPNQVTALGQHALDSMDRFWTHVPKGTFSTRQWEVLTLLVQGERVQTIADKLFLSPSTVRNHLTAIYRKFGVHSQAELLAKLLQDTAAENT